MICRICEGTIDEEDGFCACEVVPPERNKNTAGIQRVIEAVRDRLDQVFQLDTAAPGTDHELPSAGHCAAVALILCEMFGGQLMSTKVNGQSHWFNRLSDFGIDVDITGDQFGSPKIQISPIGWLYRDARERQFEEANPETLYRAGKLAKRAGYCKLQLVKYYETLERG